MPYVPPIVAYVSPRGFLYCSECVDKDGGPEERDIAWDACNSALDGEKCDMCGAAFRQVRTNWWTTKATCEPVRVSW